MTLSCNPNLRSRSCFGKGDGPCPAVFLTAAPVALLCRIVVLTEDLVTFEKESHSKPDAEQLLGDSPESSSVQVTMYTHSRPIPHRSHRKSSSGCKACKTRKVKCDEKRPVCGKCAIHFSNIESCDYDAVTRPKKTRLCTSTSNSGDSGTLSTQGGIPASLSNTGNVPITDQTSNGVTSAPYVPNSVRYLMHHCMATRIKPPHRSYTDN